jgi:hypothetical protein
MPESLEAVPSYHQAALEAIRDKRSVALGELMGRVYDPEAGQFEGHLISVAAQVREILSEAAAKVREGLDETYELVAGLVEYDTADLFRRIATQGNLSLYGAVGKINLLDEPEKAALRAGLDARVLRAAEGGPSLHQAVRSTEAYGTDEGKPAMRVALDSRVLRAAEGGPSLHQAVRSTEAYGTAKNQPHMREHLNGRVRAVALDASTAYQALRTVGTYAVGPEAEHMERQVANIWLPRKTASLHRGKALEKQVKTQLKEFDEQPLWKRGFKVFQGRALRRQLKYARITVNSYTASVEQLTEILKIDED